MLLARVKDFTRQNNVYLIAGTPYFSENGKIFNSLVAFSPAGELVDRFDKKHLVPFGEYLPFRFIFYPLLKNSGNYFEEDFDSNPRVKLLKIKDYTVGAAICFESTFPYIIRERIRSGGDFILVSTNDAWFGDSSAATQHFYAGVFRAVENGCYLVQVANTGISGIIDPCGRVLERTGVGEKGSIIANIGEKGKGTFYLKYGNLLVSLCLLGVASLVFWDRLKGLTKRR